MKEEEKSGAERRQRATRDEEWSDDRLKTFLDVEPPEGMPAGYNMLLRAYRGMTADLFERFVAFYVEAGHDIDVALEDGSTFLDLVAGHRRSTAYASILEAAGAVPKP